MRRRQSPPRYQTLVWSYAEGARLHSYIYSTTSHSPYGLLHFPELLSSIPLYDPTLMLSPAPPLVIRSSAYRATRGYRTTSEEVGIALGPGYEVGDSSSAAAARLAGGLRVDYGFVATMDREIRRDPVSGWIWDHRLVG
ncbi:hypothetical protein Tco_1006404 [Tanacetum coccineum]|uniref:Uncharacterized protein n=1 Tax=Tanacetum coccineum TaxID=301880 RepID=A0ABQ5FHI1_9ASTR